MSTSAERQRKHRASKTDPVRAFLLALLARPEVDAATLNAQDTAAELLDRLDVADDRSELSKIAAAFGVKATRGRSILSMTETRRNDALATLTARVKAGEATATETRVGLRIAGKAIRAERAPVDETAVAIAVARVLSGAEGGLAAVPYELRSDVYTTEEDRDDE